MHIEPGIKVRITHKRTKTSRICLIAKVEGNVIYYVTNIKGILTELSSTTGIHMTVEPVVSVCDRCLKEVDALQMSIFNTEMCCKDCLEIERAHSKYQVAKDKEHAQVVKGNYNYKGAGLPKDLKLPIRTFQKYMADEREGK